MTFKEAVLSGKPFRRKGWGWVFDYWLEEHYGWLKYVNGYGVKNLKCEDFWQDDWEVYK